MTRPPEVPQSHDPGALQGQVAGWGQQPPHPGPGAGWERPTQPSGQHGPGPDGWPPQGDGASAWSGGPQAPEPSRGGGTNKALLTAGIAALVTVLAAAVLLVLVLTGGDDETAAAPASTPTASSSAELEAFLATLPADFADCRETPRAGDGDLLAAGCGAALTQPGPTGARFYLYPDVETLDGVFSSDVDSTGLAEFTDDQDCSTTVGYGSWRTTGGTGGLYGCAILDDGTVTIAWTDDEFRTEGIVSAPGTTQADVAALYAWWSENSYFQG